MRECDINEIESCFDDLNEARRLVSEYRDKGGVLDREMKQFNSLVVQTLRTFRYAISSLDEEKVEKCLDVYGNALDGETYDNKFATFWREMLTEKREKVCISCFFFKLRANLNVLK